MLAVDTNVIVRYLTRDDVIQFAKAEALIASNDLFVATTVLLESEWVLRRGYRFTRVQIAEALGAFAGLPRTTLEDPALAAKAFDWMNSGMDFADALHLAGTEHCEAFVSFDRRLATVASRIGHGRVRPP